MAKVNQSPERYVPSGGGWQITAQPEFKAQFPNSTKTVPPITIGKGPGIQPAPLPLLEADGIIVVLDGQPLASPQTIAQMAEDDRDNNPHNSPVPRIGTVNGKEMGGTMPVLNLSTKGFLAAGDLRDIKNKRAGVKSVDYLYEGSQTDGIPTNLLNQINYTLNPQRERPADTFQVYDLKLGGDYSIQQLVIATKQGDNFLDRQKLETFVTEVGDRLRSLRDDFNAIKSTFFTGTTPPNNGWTTFTQVASADEPDPSHTVVTKEYELTGLTYNQ